MEILIPDIPVIEKLARTAVIDGFLLVAFPLAGKRQLALLEEDGRVSVIRRRPA